MQIMKMEPGKPQCLLYAAAMLLNDSPEYLAEILGHDGMDVVNPQCKDASRYKSIHIQEIMDLFIRKGLGLMPIELHPMVASSHNVTPNSCYTSEEEEARFCAMLGGREGIMIGHHNKSCVPHAWAWDGRLCYDPNGFTAELTDYKIDEAWIKVKLI